MSVPQQGPTIRPEQVIAEGDGARAGEVSLRLLGPVELRAGGRVVDPGSERQRTVLAALAITAGWPVPVDTLIGRVWGPNPPAGAFRGLYTDITRLRQTFRQAGLDGDVVRLVVRSGGYTLNLDPDLVDAVRFRRLFRTAMAGPRDAADRLRSRDLLDEAVRLWRGPALAGLPGRWAETTRRTLHVMRLDVLVTWAGAQLRLGRPDAVVDELAAVLEQHPLVEPLAARLIEALAAQGRIAAARAVYADLCTRLFAQRHVEPGTWLRSLHENLPAGPVLPAHLGACG